MKAKLTKSLVDKLRKGEADAFRWDTELSGFGCKITPEGRRVFLVQYRMGGRGFPTRRYTIGTYGAFTVDSARDFAEDLLGQVRKGIDPMADKASGRINNISRLIAQFTKSRREKGRRTADEVQRLLEREVEPAWGTRPVVSITPADVAQLVDAILDRGSPGTANQTVVYLKAMFNWALRRGAIQASPASGTEKPAPDVRRERTHTGPELVEIWRAAETLGYPFGTALQLLILTGQRREEVGQIGWAEINRDKAVWTIPGDRTKNGQPHDVHLSKQALAVIGSVPARKNIDLLFTTTGDTPVSGWSKASKRMRTAIADGRREVAVEAGEDPEKVKQMPDWVVHDLRRTFATGCNDLGVAPHVADRILNHVAKKKGGVMAVYNRAEYAAERRAAMTIWAEHVQRLLDGNTAKILPMKRRRK